ncbi:MAG: hypothetical protein DI629_13560 [Mesorhizobium amorphae]|nr:MAG: hypothetical protein DI629_13560 [Mesorhizobium amorphae]
MAKGFLAEIVEIFEGDPGVRRVADDPVLTAELLLLFRMILADGEVSEAELAVFERICREAFSIEEDSLDGVIEYLEEAGYETTGAQALGLFAELPLERRRALARHMADIAKADHALAPREVLLLKRSLDVLGLEPEDAVLQPR